MKKDNFDLRTYLVENKMTENSRGKVRHHFGDVLLDTRILSEMQIPADPDQDDPDFEADADQLDDMWDAQMDASLDESSFGSDYLEKVRNAYGEDDEYLDDLKFNDSFEILRDRGLLTGNPKEDNARISDVMSDGVGLDMNYAPGWREEAGFEDDLDECGVMDNIPLDEGIDRDALYKEYVGYQTKYGAEKAMKIMQKFHPEIDFTKVNIIPRYARQNQAQNDKLDVARNTRLHSRDIGNENPDWRGDAGYLKEEGYVDDDDDDDWQKDDLDFDDNGGKSLLDLVGRKDKAAAKAKKAAAKDTAADPAMDDDVPSDVDAPVDDDAEVEPTIDNAPTQAGLSSQLKYNPETVEFEMDPAELDQYLSNFRRPQVAVRVLNQALKAAQDEVNDSIGLKSLYLILDKGFYKTSRAYRGNVIAKVSADQAWRDKEFGADAE